MNQSNLNETTEPRITINQIAGIAASVSLVGAAAFIGMRYKVCRPEQMMVRTGLGIKSMSVAKQGVQ